MQGERPQADRQLPLGEETFLDHVGHFVRDPQAASAAHEDSTSRTERRGAIIADTLTERAARGRPARAIGAGRGRPFLGARCGAHPGLKLA